LKTITLIRHGKPEACKRYPFTSIVSGLDIQNFINDYNNCNLLNTTVPQYLQCVLNEGDFFVSSNLKRARDSFELLGVHAYDVSDLFAEAELPYGILNNLRMPLFLWAFFLRMVWYLGFTKNCESFVDFKKRTKEANTYLQKKFDHYDNVVIMAHGFVNMLLEKELLNDNWARVEGKNRNKFFSYKKFSKS
jgi:hypothetical protein